MLVFTAHPPELVAFARSVLLDLDAAGALADWLDEHDGPPAPYISGKPSPSRGEMLRRRWRAWKKERATAGDKLIAFVRQHIPWLLRLSPTAEEYNRSQAVKGADDCFRRYIARRFLPRATRI